MPHMSATPPSAPTVRPAADVPHVALDPFSDEFLTDPYRHHAALRDSGPVFWIEPYGIYGMARYDDVAAALQDWQTFCSSRGVGLSDFARETPWRPVSLSALRQVQPAWRAQAEQLADGLVARRRFDAVVDLAERYPMLVFPDTIGLQHEGREHLLAYAAATFNAFGPRNHLFEETNATAAAAIAWVASACKRERLRDDGWGMNVYRAADAGDCTPDEAERLVRSFLSAGVDTTVNGLGNLVHALATHPEQWQRLCAEPTLRKRAFEESLRWDSTVQTFFRTTTRAVDVGGTTVPADAKVLLLFAAANRDPRRWPDPDTFDVGRQTSGHVAFGYGIHQCLGQMFARQEADLVLEALIPRVRSMRLAGPPVRRLNNTLRALAHLPVEVEPA
jgi:4-methoxybenzoate monooxygenase (O-demethylating)